MHDELNQWERSLLVYDKVVTLKAIMFDSPYLKVKKLFGYESIWPMKSGSLKRFFDRTLLNYHQFFFPRTRQLQVRLFRVRKTHSQDVALRPRKAT